MELSCRPFLDEFSAFCVGKMCVMSDVTRILSAIDKGDPSAAEQLLPLVYDELRNLAAARLAHEKPGQTLQATALVHEVYVRLVDQPTPQQWHNQASLLLGRCRGHATNPRRKRSPKESGKARRQCGERSDSRIQDSSSPIARRSS